jgi:heat-inducible transcriptional repressor
MTKSNNITQRQAKILAAIVKEYSETGNPVASQDLLERGYFDCSGATIRNEMQVLERADYSSSYFCRSYSD